LAKEELIMVRLRELQMNVEVVGLHPSSYHSSKMTQGMYWLSGIFGYAAHPGWVAERKEPEN
jgi:hypothetical protein